MLLVAGAVQGQQPAAQPGGSAGISGTVVNAASGRPEAGVWVIAETKSLPVPFRKIVVTDDQGRFLAPDLPAGAYEVWVRGYGLKDSARTKADRGGQVRLQAADAATPREAARIYPASEWASLIRPPAQETLPAEYKTQEQWLAGLRKRVRGRPDGRRASLGTRSARAYGQNAPRAAACDPGIRSEHRLLPRSRNRHVDGKSA